MSYVSSHAKQIQMKPDFRHIPFHIYSLGFKRVTGIYNDADPFCRILQFLNGTRRYHKMTIAGSRLSLPDKNFQITSYTTMGIIWFYKWLSPVDVCWSQLTQQWTWTKCTASNIILTFVTYSTWVMSYEEKYHWTLRQAYSKGIYRIQTVPIYLSISIYHQ